VDSDRPEEPTASSPDDAARDEKLSLLETLRLLGRASRGYWGVNFVNFGDGIAYFGVLNLLVLYLQHDAGMGTHGAHIAVSTFTGIVTVGMFLGGGFISDWLGVRRALTLAIALVLGGRAILLAAPVAGGAVAVAAAAWTSLAIMGVGEAVIQPALYAGVKEYSDRRTATMGYALIYSIMNLGIVAESMLSPVIRGWTRQWQGTTDNPAGGIGGVYAFIIAVTAVMLVGHLLIFTRRVEQTQRVVDDEPAAKEEQSLGEKLRSLPLLDPRFLFFIFILLPVRTLFAHQWLTVPDYVMRAFPAEVGERFEWISALNPGIIVIGVPLIAAWTRRVNIVTMMIIGTMVSALATALLVPAPDVRLLVLYVVVFSIGEAAWSSRFLEYVAELAPAGRVGAYMGIATLPWFLAKATTGWYSGYVLDAFVPKGGPYDGSTMWMVYGAIALVSPIGLWLARGWIEKGVPKTEDGAA
jgi:dipeptide/tripeptide permease